MRATAFALVSAWMLSQSSVAQQLPLTANDSARLRVAVLTVLLDSVGTVNQRSGRIWVRYSGAGEAHNRASVPSPSEMATITSVFPTARVVTYSDTVFMCPPGVQVDMPGRGCPIRESGVIVELFDLRVKGDSLWTTGSLIQSNASGTATWANMVGLLFIRVRGAWQFARTTSRFIT